MKQDSDQQLESLHAAIAAAGSQSRLADALGLSFQHIQQWRRAGRVPAERVLSVETAVNGAVTRYQLRPDVFGEAPAKAAA
jgi:DNA-binding transcriptional regulator YdaS (Cro superfamily)